MIEIVIYDVDDTLLNTTLGSAQNMHYALTQFPSVDSAMVPDLAVVIDRAIAPTWKEWAASCLPGIDADAFREFYRGMVDELPAQFYPLFEGTQEALNFTGTLGPQGIVTSRERGMFLRRAAAAGLDLGQFAFTHTYEDVELSKPSPLALEPGIQIIESKGIPRERIVYAGDRVDDYTATRDAGISFVGVKTGPERSLIANLAERKGVGVIDSVADLPTYIQTHNQMEDPLKSKISGTSDKSEE